MPAESVDRALGASYRLVEPIGRGAAGEVWRAVDRRSDETVAAKLLRAEYVEDHELVGRFLRERTILVGLRHPNIVPVRDLVAEGDLLAIVMEYVGPDPGSENLPDADRDRGSHRDTLDRGSQRGALDGGSLRTALDGGPLPIGLALQVTTAVLDGLALAHRRRVIHRDVKPDNILLAPGWRTSAPAGVKLSDFGVSSLIGERGSTTGLVGTPAYMAPELLLAGSADSGADIYAAGVLIYELLAGRTPFAGPGTGYAVAHRHVTNLPPRLPVPDPLWSMLAALLDKDPGRRPDARTASARLRALPGWIRNLPALLAQSAPDAFAAAGVSATELRGIERPSPSASVQSDSLEAPERSGDAPTPTGSDVSGARPGGTRGSSETGAGSAPLPDLGVSTHETVHRAMPVVSVTAEPETTRPTRMERLLPARVRQLRWRSPGAVATARRNVNSVTGVDAPCAWAVVPEPIIRRGTVSVAATVALARLGGDASTALQEWLQTAASATEAATSDSDTTSTAYPAQRLTGVQAVAPSRTVSGTTLRISLLPVWPNGVDQLNPLLVSPPSGPATRALVSVAGGTSGVRFADGCSGALTVSEDGLVVTAQSVSDNCHVGATVGNFTDLESNTFSITTRGS